MRAVCVLISYVSISGSVDRVLMDQFAGRFDRNDELTISPLYVTHPYLLRRQTLTVNSKSAFLFIRLPAGFARQIAPEMNRAGASKFTPVPAGVIGIGHSPIDSQSRERMRYEDDQKIRRVYDDWLEEQARPYEDEQGVSFDQHQDQIVFGGERRKLTPGYVTKDACPSKGDDIEHVPCTSRSGILLNDDTKYTLTRLVPPSVQQPFVAFLLWFRGFEG